MIRALFFDLDGTLLSSEKRIPESARTAIARCRERGVKVFFATARSPRLRQTLKWTDAEYALFDGGVYANGGCVEFGGGMRHCYIDSRAVRICIEQAARFEDVHLSLHTPQEGYAFNFPVDDFLIEDWGLNGANIRRIDDATIAETTKMMIFYDHLNDSHPLPEQLGHALQTACAGLANVYITDGGSSIQVTGVDSGKLKGIESIRRQLGLETEEVCVFGDDVNDLEMISFYPNSVAMGNAVESIRQAAKFVTRTNDEDGVAFAIEMLLDGTGGV